MGSFTSEKIWEYDGSGRGDRYMYVTVSQTKGTATENKSTVSWTIYADGASYWADTGPTTLTIGGIERYYKGRTSWSAGTFPVANGSVSGSFTVDHDDNGTTPDLAVSLSTAINTGQVSSVTGTLTMDKIDRYFSQTPTLTLTSKDETSMSFDWGTSETCSIVVCYYKLSTASLWSNITKYNDSTGATSGSFSLTGLTAGKTYNVYIKATRKDSGLESDSATNSYDTYKYPYIKNISVNPLTIGNQQTVTFYNPLGRTITFYMKQNNTSGTTLYSASNLSPGTGESIIYSFTPAANTLYNSIPNVQVGNGVYYCVYTDSGNISHTSDVLIVPYQIVGTEVPTFTANQIKFRDSNTVVTQQTNQGSYDVTNPWMVQSLSNLEIKLDSVATSNYYVDINNFSYSASIAGVTKTLGKTAGSIQTWNALNAVGDVILSVTVTDSRNLSTTITKTIRFVSYQNPSISLEVSRNNNYGPNVTIKTSWISSPVIDPDSGASQFYKNMIRVGIIANNMPNTGNTFSWYPRGTSSGFGIAGNGNATNTSITNANNSKSYTFTATILDKFGKTATVSVILPIGQPLMFVDSEQMGVGINKFPTVAGLDVAGSIKTNNEVNFNGQWTEKCDTSDGNRLKFKKGNYTISMPESKSGTVALTSDLPTFNLLDVYPIGSVYISTVNTNPGTLFGGTWTAIGDYFLYSKNPSTGTSKQTGGNTSVTLTEENIPAHSHSIPSLSGTAANAGGHSHEIGADKDAQYQAGGGDYSVHDNGTSGAGKLIATSSVGDHTHDVTTTASTTGSYGGDSENQNATVAISTLPPYFTVFAWERTA